MKTTLTTPSAVTNNRAEHRFELDTDGKLSVVEYQPRGETTLALTHTEVPEELEGHGVGSRLVRGVFEYVRENGLNVIPLCPFVVAFLHRHPEFVAYVHPAYQGRFAIQ